MSTAAGESRSPGLVGKAAPLLLAAAMVAAAALILWLNRGSALFFDEVLWFADLGDRDRLVDIAHPHNNHLIGMARSLYLLQANTIGVEYVVVRIVAVIGVLLVAGLLFTYARRRVGDWIALAPAVLLLVYGSAWQHVVSPIGLSITYSIAAGLAALIALDRGDRRGDVLAAVFACLSIFTYTIGLSYLVGIAISVLLRADRIRRSWIFLVPLLLYLPWWLWARQFSDGRVSVENFRDAPGYIAESLANVSGSLTGVAVPFSRFGDQLAGIASAPGGPLGVAVAVMIAVAVVWRLLRGSVPRSLWISLAILGSYWLMSALADTPYLGGQADAVRYILPGTVALLLVLVSAGEGLRPRREVLVAVAAVLAFSLVMNLYFLRDGARFVRDAGNSTNVNLAMMEVAGGLEPGLGAGEGGTPGELPPREPGPLPGLSFPPDPDRYLAAVEKFGSPTIGFSELAAMPAPGRFRADTSLIAQQQIALAATGERPRGSACSRLRAGSAPVPLPPGEFLLRAGGGADVAVSLRRLGDDPGTGIGVAGPGGWSRLSIPADGLPEQPWMVVAPAAGVLRVCPAGNG